MNRLGRVFDELLGGPESIDSPQHIPRYGDQASQRCSCNVRARIAMYVESPTRNRLHVPSVFLNEQTEKGEPPNIPFPSTADRFCSQCGQFDCLVGLTQFCGGCAPLSTDTDAHRPHE
jgi:hypothetical protein